VDLHERRRQPYDAISVKEILDRADVGRSTFYTHFRDKADLLMRLATTMVAASFDVASAWEPTDGAEGLADTFLRVIGVYREHIGVVRAVAEVGGYDATVRAFWHDRLDRFRDRTIAVLREEQDAGRSPASVSLASAAQIIVMGGERAIFDHVTDAGSNDDASFARELALTWWYGVYRRPAG